MKTADLILYGAAAAAGAYLFTHKGAAPASSSSVPTGSNPSDPLDASLPYGVPRPLTGADWLYTQQAGQQQMTDAAIAANWKAIGALDATDPGWFAP